MGKRGDNLSETPEAAAAFRAYVAMGDRRSLRDLAADLARQGFYKSSSSAFRVLSRWSAAHRWQERLASAITAETEAMLERAAEIDARTFLRTSELLAERIGWTDAGHVDTVVKVRESVRTPEPRGAAGAVTVTLTVTLRAIVERMAAERGLDPEEVLAQAEAILARGG